MPDLTTVLVIFVAITSILNLIGMVAIYKRQYPRIYINGDKITDEEIQSQVSGIKIKKSSKKGSIIIPPTDIEMERERIIKERSAQGLDTPIDLLRERSNDE